MTDRVVLWLGGGLVDPSTASVPWNDHGLTVGDGVFETIELRSGAPFALTRHLDRLARSCTGLMLEPPARAVVAGAVDAVAAEWGTSAGRLRITVTSGAGPMGSERGDAPPILIVSATSMTIQRDPTAVAVVPFTRNQTGALAGLKTTSYAENVLALRHARDAGASEAILANTVGGLCEGTGSNVFVEHGGVLVTPPLSSGCLAGVTRALLLEALAVAGVPAVEAALPVGALAASSEAFLVSTGRHVQPISHVDGSALPTAPGPLTERAAQIWDHAFTDAVDP